MKKKQKEETYKQEGTLKAFADEYLSAKNVALGVGIASLAGLATYSTVRALKNEKLVNRIKKELNFDHLKENINSTFTGLGLFKKQGGQVQSQGGKKTSERSPAKNTQRSSKAGAGKASKNKRRYVTG